MATSFAAAWPPHLVGSVVETSAKLSAALHPRRQQHVREQTIDGASPASSVHAEALGLLGAGPSTDLRASVQDIARDLSDEAFHELTRAVSRNLLYLDAARAGPSNLLHGVARAEIRKRAHDLARSSASLDASRRRGVGRGGGGSARHFLPGLPSFRSDHHRLGRPSLLLSFTPLSPSLPCHLSTAHQRRTSPQRPRRTFFSRSRGDDGTDRDPYAQPHYGTSKLSGAYYGFHGSDRLGGGDELQRQIRDLGERVQRSPADETLWERWFEALLAHSVPRPIISSYERLLTFDPTSPVLLSPSLFQDYLSALRMSGQASPARLEEARRRREDALRAREEMCGPTSRLLSATGRTATPKSRIGRGPWTTTEAGASNGRATPSPQSYSRSPFPPPPSNGYGGLSDPPPLPSTRHGPPSNPTRAELARAIADSRTGGRVVDVRGTFDSTTNGYGNTIGNLGAIGAYGMHPVGDGTRAGRGGERMHVVVEEAKGPLTLRLVRWALFAGLYIFGGMTLLTILFENGLLRAAGPPGTTGSPNEFAPPPPGGPTVDGKSKKVVTFDDVHGVEEAKSELSEVVEFLKDPERFTTLGGKLPKGVLLYGPPGTGKTLMARAVAGEAGVPFLFASGSEFDEMYVGVGARRIRDLFAAARKKAPSIVFIDELDAIGSKRAPNRDQQYAKQTLNQLLTDLDGFSQAEGVIFIAATNFAPENLDPALIRPGRFDKHVHVPLPDVKGRIEILNSYFRDVLVDSDVNASVIARGCPGFSGADLQNLVNQAAVKASKEGHPAVTPWHFEWAKERIMMGAERKSAYITEQVKRKTAYHEAGHALVAHLTPGAMALQKVTCIPRGGSLGYTLQLPEDDRVSISFREFLAEIDTSLGGRVAEEVIYGKEQMTSGASSDIIKATRVARSLVTRYGYSDKVGRVAHEDDDALSPQTRLLIEEEVREIIEAGESRARDIVQTHQEALHRLAEALVEHETLDAEQIVQAIEGGAVRMEELDV